MSDSLGTYLLLGMAFSAMISIAAAVAFAVLLLRLPADYFRHSGPEFWADKHPLIRRTGRLLKNTLGALLVAVGALLSLPGIPGPGIVTLLIGVMLLDMPVKRRFEMWLLRRPLVRSTINDWRCRFGKPPFQ